MIQEIPGGFSKYCPDLPYLLLSEREYSDHDLKDLNNLVAALFRLENSRDPKQLLDVVVNLLQWLSAPGQETLRRAFTVWFSRVLFPNRISNNKQPAIEELSEVKTMLAERVKEWNKESLERGFQKGIQKGKVEALTNLLELKFGQLPKAVTDKCKGANEEQLRQWSAHILTAKTLGDVFGN